MAKHEFGIMQEAPKHGHRYDEYQPQKYNCISVNDDYLEDIVAQFNDIDFFWHTIDLPGKGLAYTGVTLIPPTSMPAFIAVIDNRRGLSELKALMIRAVFENKWIIHFGL